MPRTRSSATKPSALISSSGVSSQPGLALPLEVLDLIAQAFVEEYCRFGTGEGDQQASVMTFPVNLFLTCKTFYDLALPHAYRHLSLLNESYKPFLETLEASETALTSLKHVESLTLGPMDPTLDQEKDAWLVREIRKKAGKYARGKNMDVVGNVLPSGVRINCTRDQMGGSVSLRGIISLFPDAHLSYTDLQSTRANCIQLRLHPTPLSSKEALPFRLASLNITAHLTALTHIFDMIIGDGRYYTEGEALKRRLYPSSVERTVISVVLPPAGDGAREEEERDPWLRERFVRSMAKAGKFSKGVVIRVVGSEHALCCRTEEGYRVVSALKENRVDLGSCGVACKADKAAGEEIFTHWLRSP